tara:strand:- start:172 stop:420 length:249 start_codon:yes stop_codon:yes gene_type:complete
MDLLLIVNELVAKWPVLSSVLLVVGALRLTIKPLVSIVRSVVELTPGKTDDLLLDKVEASKVYKGLCWVLDYLTSIKLPGAK